ncbi:MAG: hypothetical protein ACLS7W_06760 [Bifidobacterium longum]|uniref:hypothetical protein n=2 Tax=Bifidobacterium TaxID=1678 RepID=UPI001E5A41C1|nr:hypothetical protein [Bifidobacterium longum]WAT11984.1 hypothetical protein O0R44_09140 [Bifidobacterium longum subsp. infantis]
MQIVAVARHILDDQVATVDGTGGMRLLKFPIGHHIQWGAFTFKRCGGGYRTRRCEHGKRYARHRWFDDIAYSPYMHDQVLLSTYFNDDANVPLQCTYAYGLCKAIRRFWETRADSGTVHGARIKYHSPFG